MTDTIFVGNGALMGTAEGGAVYLEGGMGGLFEDCVFARNNADEGSGGALYVTGSYAINDCLFSGNEALDGGAIEVFAETLELSDVFFTGNVAIHQGGAIENFGSVEVENAVFTGNNANSGGAIYAVGEATLTNATFSGNHADGSGSGIFVEATETNGVNSILWDDILDELAGGGIITFDYSDIWGYPIGETHNIDSSPLFVGNPKTSGEWTCVTYHEDTYMTELCITPDTWDDSDLVGLFVQPDAAEPNRYFIVERSTDSIFIYGNYVNAIDEADNFLIFDLHLGSESPCIDRGDGGDAPARDIEGNFRVDDPLRSGGVGFPNYTDMGAYERQ